MQNKSPLTVFDDQLPVGGKWENVEFLSPHSHQAVPSCYYCALAVAIFFGCNCVSLL